MTNLAREIGERMEQYPILITSIQREGIEHQWVHTPQKLQELFPCENKPQSQHAVTHLLLYVKPTKRLDMRSTEKEYPNKHSKTGH